MRQFVLQFLLVKNCGADYTECYKSRMITVPWRRSFVLLLNLSSSPSKYGSLLVPKIIFFLKRSCFFINSCKKTSSRRKKCRTYDQKRDYTCDRMYELNCTRALLLLLVISAMREKSLESFRYCHVQQKMNEHCLVAKHLHATRLDWRKQIIVGPPNTIAKQFCKATKLNNADFCVPGAPLG